MVAAAYFGHVDVGDWHFQKLVSRIAIGRESVVCLVAEPGHEGPRPFPWLTRYDKNVYLGGYSRQETALFLPVITLIPVASVILTGGVAKGASAGEHATLFSNILRVALKGTGAKKKHCRKIFEILYLRWVEGNKEPIGQSELAGLLGIGMDADQGFDH